MTKKKKTENIGFDNVTLLCNYTLSRCLSKEPCQNLFNRHQQPPLNLVSQIHFVISLQNLFCTYSCFFLLIESYVHQSNVRVKLKCRY